MVCFILFISSCHWRTKRSGSVYACGRVICSFSWEVVTSVWVSGCVLYLNDCGVVKRLGTDDADSANGHVYHRGSESGACVDSVIVGHHRDEMLEAVTPVVSVVSGATAPVLASTPEQQ